MCCVLCFVLSPKQSSVLKCHLSQYQKMKIMSYVFWRVSSKSSPLSGGCVSFWFWQEIGSFFVVAGNFYYDRKIKKFQSSVWRVGILHKIVCIDLICNGYIEVDLTDLD